MLNAAEKSPKETEIPGAGGPIPALRWFAAPMLVYVGVSRVVWLMPGVLRLIALLTFGALALLWWRWTNKRHGPLPPTTQWLPVLRGRSPEAGPTMRLRLTSTVAGWFLLVTVGIALLNAVRPVEDVIDGSIADIDRREEWQIWWWGAQWDLDHGDEVRELPSLF